MCALCGRTQLNGIPCMWEYGDFEHASQPQIVLAQKIHYQKSGQSFLSMSIMKTTKKQVLVTSLGYTMTEYFSPRRIRGALSKRTRLCSCTYLCRFFSNASVTAHGRSASTTLCPSTQSIISHGCKSHDMPVDLFRYVIWFAIMDTEEPPTSRVQCGQYM